MFKILFLTVSMAATLAACDSRGPYCLWSSKETAMVLEVEDLCAQRRHTDCAFKFQRMRLQREDGTVCAVERSIKWIYKPGDKVRGPL